MDQAGAFTSGLSIEGEIDKLAFVDAVTTYQSLVFSVAYHILHNATLAEEIAQDIFSRLCQGLDSLLGSHRSQLLDAGWVAQRPEYFSCLRQHENRRDCGRPGDHEWYVQIPARFVW
jgi:hypothetical protein